MQMCCLLVLFCHLPLSFFSIPSAAHNGSISAEHCLGFKKANYIHYSKPPEAVQLMTQIKHVLDPLVCDGGLVCLCCL